MSTTDKIIVRENKTLKLNNVLIREVDENEFIDVNKAIYMLESYIKLNGNAITGPMINYTALSQGADGQPKIIIKLIVQLKNPIQSIEMPYEYKTQIKVPNCLFARFSEKEDNIDFAYSKLNLYAFENDITLVGDHYTVFVDRKEKNIVADVFMQIQMGGEDFEDI